MWLWLISCVRCDYWLNHIHNINPTTTSTQPRPMMMKTTTATITTMTATTIMIKMINGKAPQVFFSFFFFSNFLMVYLFFVLATTISLTTSMITMTTTMTRNWLIWPSHKPLNGLKQRWQQQQQRASSRAQDVSHLELLVCVFFFKKLSF